MLALRNMEKIHAAFYDIFPDGNRNAGGAAWVHHAAKTAASPEEFDAMARSFCGVSGSPVYGGAAESLPVGGSCYEMHRCCWPCICDAARFGKAEEIEVPLKSGTVHRTFLTVPDPCRAPPGAMPETVTAFVCSGGKTQNALHSGTGRVAMAVLKPSEEPCGISPSCVARNQTPIDKLRGGMGDIFAKVATIG